MQTKKIAIIGAKGNVGLDFLAGHIHSEEHSKAFTIMPVIRDYFDDERIFPETLKSIGKCDIIFLPVKPRDAVSLLILLKDSIKPGALIVSPVSGLDINVIVRILNIPYDRIVKMTQNIHMGTKDAIVVYSVTKDSTAIEVEKLFHGITKAIIRRPAREIPRNVVMIGSNSATFAKHMILLSEKSHLPFGNFLNSLSMENADVAHVVHTMKIAFWKTFHSYDSFVEITYESTLSHLQKTCNCPEDIINHIDRVATLGGCTRKGVDKFDSLEKISVESFRDILLTMYRPVKLFERKIQSDFNIWRKASSPKEIVSVDSLIPYKFSW